MHNVGPEHIGVGEIDIQLRHGPARHCLCAKTAGQRQPWIAPSELNDNEEDCKVGLCYGSTNNADVCLWGENEKGLSVCVCSDGESVVVGFLTCVLLVVVKVE